MNNLAKISLTFRSFLLANICISVSCYHVIHQFSSVAQLCSTLYNPMDCSTPGFLSIPNSWSFLKLMTIESVMPSNHLIHYRFPFSSCLQSFPASGTFTMSQFFASGGQSIERSALASVLPKNIQD